MHFHGLNELLKESHSVGALSQVLWKAVWVVHSQTQNHKEANEGRHCKDQKDHQGCPMSDRQCQQQSRDSAECKDEVGNGEPLPICRNAAQPFGHVEWKGSDHGDWEPDCCADEVEEEV